MSFQGAIVANVAVSDLARSKAFYGEKVGLEQTDENQGGITYTAGGGRLFVYQSRTAGTGQATTFTLEVDDVEALAADLKDKGVAFEQYDMPGAERHGDVVHMGPFKAAWFKDPDGNIVGIASKM